jgi:DDE superfamily endonuclease
LKQAWAQIHRWLQVVECASLRFGWGCGYIQGKHFTFPTPDRSGFEFAQVLVTLPLQYPEAKTIHLLMDNLNIHRRKSLADVFGSRNGRGSLGPLHGPPHAYSWKLAQTGGDRNRDLLPAMFGEPKNPWSEDAAPVSAGLESAAVNRDRVKIAWKFDRRAAQPWVSLQKEILHTVKDLAETPTSS